MTRRPMLIKRVDIDVGPRQPPLRHRGRTRPELLRADADYRQAPRHPAPPPGYFVTAAARKAPPPTPRRTDGRLLFVALICLAAGFLVGLLVNPARAQDRAAGAPALHLVGHGLSVHGRSGWSEPATTTAWKTDCVDAGGRKIPLCRQVPVTVDTTVDRRYRADNVGLGLRVQTSAMQAHSLAVQGGVYRNSHDRTSVYAIADWLPLQMLGARVGVFAGAVNGYAMRDGGVVPAAGATARWQGQRLALQLRAVPPLPDKTAGALAIELGWRL